MKVILLRDVAKLGKRFSVAEVADGYALNQLIPKGMAEAASPLNLKRVNARAEKQIISSLDAQTEFSRALKALAESGVTLALSANAQSHLFQAVKASDITTAAATLGQAIPVDSISLDEPIKALGTYPIKATLGTVSGMFTLEVISNQS
jgi:large subunit ribosomal protein L9